MFRLIRFWFNIVVALVSLKIFKDSINESSRFALFI